MRSQRTIGGSGYHELQESGGKNNKENKRSDGDDEHHWCSCFSKDDQSEMPEEEFRDVVIGEPDSKYPNNEISTTKYTKWNFIFKNTFEQFSKVANLYFLFLAVLQTIPQISDTGGLPTYLPPLLTIVVLSMIKDAYEDYKRYKSDEEENNKETLVFRDGRFNNIPWKDVQVGDVVKVEKDKFFPADLVMLGSSSTKKGQCFIETKNLDGETNLKSKYVQDDIHNACPEEAQVMQLLGGNIHAESPTINLNKFKGTMSHRGLGNTEFPLSERNLLLRGCILRNTDWIIGCTVYTG